jgi:two-component system sensor histidine kinase/response regulator
MATSFTGSSEKIIQKTALSKLGQFFNQYCQQNDARILRQTEFQNIQPETENFWCISRSNLTLLVTITCPPSTESDEQCLVRFCYQKSLVKEFLSNFAHQPGLSASDRQLVTDFSKKLESTSHDAQVEFMMSVLAVCIEQSSNPSTVACRPVQEKLDQQLERNVLLNQVITKIQESLELSSILQTTVDEVRQFLEADRLLIYQFDQPEADDHIRSMALAGGDTEALVTNSGNHQFNGYITYESRANDHLKSVLHYTENYCFQNLQECHPRYREGRPFAVDDVNQTYRESQCLLNFLNQVQVKSKLVTPILVGKQLWGLLIIHQCEYVRHWQPWELEFLQHIAEHLAIAINQAQLYRQLQQQTQNLEICVIERTQDLRDALAAAQSANRAKSEFLATMSHELRTPLTCIIGMSATLLRWSLGDLSPRQRDYLNTIHASGEHLLSVINDILEVSKIEAGRTVLEVREFSLSTLSRQSIDAFRNEAFKNGIELVLDLKLPPGEDLFNADPRRIRQILTNLLSNAIKFTRAEGKVTLRVRKEQNAAVFQVEDTGIGIPASAQSLLFEKFQQLESARQREYQGTGLGLALTKQLVELHGGSIKVTSEVGVGSVFTVRIPLQRQTGTLDNDLGELSAEPVIGRIVLVEDNEESASLICDMLTAADYQVIWIVDGSRVLDQVELLQPAAVISNVALASADGYEIIESLRHYVGTLGVKILALLNQNDLAQSERARTAGAEAVLVKPINPSELLSTINGLMASQFVSDSTLRQ